jgi:S-adenosylmethionine-dependent methyltransferase
LRIIGKTGVRVIHDYMRHKQDQVEVRGPAGLRAAILPPGALCFLGRYIHVMAQKPAG